MRLFVIRSKSLVHMKTKIAGETRRNIDQSRLCRRSRVRFVVLSGNIIAVAPTSGIDMGRRARCLEGPPTQENQSAYENFDADFSSFFEVALSTVRCPKISPSFPRR
jgi:hypothetical protein